MLEIPRPSLVAHHTRPIREERAKGVGKSAFGEDGEVTSPSKDGRGNGRGRGRGSRGRGKTQAVVTRRELLFDQNPNKSARVHKPKENHERKEVNVQNDKALVLFSKAGTSASLELPVDALEEDEHSNDSNKKQRTHSTRSADQVEATSQLHQMQ